MVKFYLNRPKAARSPIIAAVAAFGYRIRYSTGITINTALWDAKNQRMKPLTDLCAKINISLAAIRDKADNIITAHKIDRDPLAPEDLITMLQSDHQKAVSKTFKDQFTEFIADKARTSKPSSMKRYNSCLQLVEEYRPGLKKLTGDILEDFTKWMLQNKYSANYVKKMVSLLESFSNFTGNPVKGRVKVRSVSSNKVYLSPEDLNKLESVKINTLPVARVRDIFVFACWTGMRHSDLVAFNPSMVVNLQGTKCLSFVSQKTGNRSVVPLAAVCLEILTRYSGTLPRVPTDQRFNIMIKEACKLAGITEQVQISKLQGETRVPLSVPKYKAVSSHTARRTFVSNMTNLGLNNKQIGKMIGNTKIIDTYDLAEPELNAIAVAKLFS